MSAQAASSVPAGSSTAEPAEGDFYDAEESVDPQGGGSGAELGGGPEESLEEGQEEGQEAVLTNGSPAGTGDAVEDASDAGGGPLAPRDEEADSRQESSAEQAPGMSGPPQVLPGLGPASQPAQLSRDEIASAFSYFTATQGYRNPVNVLTPDLLQARLGAILTMSLHYCEGLLRAPYGTTRPAGDSSTVSLTPAQAAEILGYRVAPSDDVDFAAESFLILGARSYEDEIPMETIAQLLSRAYEGMDDQVLGASDYGAVCEQVYQQDEALYKIRAKQDAEDGLPVRKYVRKDQVQDRDYQPVGEQDVIDVLRMCVGDKDTLNLEDWRALYSSLASLDFLDYRKEIQRILR